jgi:predicted dehydrogenase
VAAAKKYRRICQVGTQCRSNRALQDAMKFLAEGGIGQVNFARGLCYKRRGSIGPLGGYPIPEEADFNLWSGPAPYTTPKLTRPRFHYDWHWQRLYGNGDSGNQGPHQTDIARWGLGINRHPNSVITYGGRLGYQAERKDPNYVDAGDTANTEIAIYDYGDKCMVFETRGLSVDNAADIRINTMFDSTRGNKIGVIFYGTEGYLVQESYTHCVVFDLKGQIVKEFNGGGDHYDNFIRAVRSRKPEEGLRRPGPGGAGEGQEPGPQHRDAESNGSAPAGQRRRSGQVPALDGPAAPVRPGEGGFHEQPRGWPAPAPGISRALCVSHTREGVIRIRQDSCAAASPSS